MTGKERITNILQHKAVDRIGIYEHFWNDTHASWEQLGHVTKEQDFDDLFLFDMSEYWAFNMTIDLDWKPETIAQTEDTITIKDGNGAILKKHKHHDTTPEHVDFTVKEQEDWDKVKHKLTIDPRRIRFEEYRKAKKAAADANRFFVWSGVNVFELMHPVCGHEHMLVGMLLEPDWIAEMAEQFMTVTLGLMEILFAQEGYPDGLWFYEDMGFKQKPFMSPEHYQSLIMPSHIRSCQYAHDHDMYVIMHSCGFVEPLLPYMIEAGIDCLQVIEIKAGMDLLKLYEEFGDKIAFMGGIDVRTLYSNDKAIIDAELESKIPIVKKGFGYVVHSDHSIPKTVDFETYQYFIQKALELGTY